MMRALLRGTLSALMLLTLVACSEPTKEDLLEKAKGVSTRAELEKTLGKPDDISKLGPIEQWTYQASNGNVIFVLTGDSVTMQATAAGENKKK